MLDDLRHLLLVVEHSTFTAAAQHAHLSQPAFSASIQRLEEHFGAQLLLRGRRGASLTAAGRALLPRAQLALNALSDGKRAIAELESLARGEVRIGAGATAATYLLPPLLAHYRKSYPGVRIVMRELSTPALEAQLAQGQLDLCVVSGPDGETWQWDEFILVAAPGSEWDMAQPDVPFITFGQGTTTRSVLEEYFPRAEIVMELGSIAAAKGHVREGMGVALISRAAVGRDLSQGHLVELPHPQTPIPRELTLLHRGNESLPPAARALRELMLSWPCGEQAAAPRKRATGARKKRLK
ncbi:MAG: LysR family transcriptional regulator [Polyangiaceae bacterium]